MNAAELQALEREIASMGPTASFPWHPQQEYALRAATDIVSINGGNQSGKTQSGLGAVARLVRREGPIYARLRNPVGRRLKIWVAPKTDEKYKSAWESRIMHFVFAGKENGVDFKYKQNPHPMWTWEDAQGGGEIWGKAQKQGFQAFESDAVDLIVFDEEPEDPRILSSAKARFATTNGVLLLCFTPLLGMSFTYHSYYKPTARDEFMIADRVWRRGNAITIIEMGMADNPESVAGGGVARIENDPTMTRAEKDSRLLGKYGFTEGLLFPNWASLGLHDDDPYFLDRLPSGRSYTWMITADPNKSHGGLLTAIDHEGNRYYCQEHYARNIPDSQHAQRYHKMLQLWGQSMQTVEAWADPGGAGSQAIINLAEGGIFAAPVRKDPGSVAAGIKRLRGASHIDRAHRHPITGAFGAPRTFFIRYNPDTGRGLHSEWTEGDTPYSESRLCFEIRQYRQKSDSPPDTPVKQNDDVVDPMRYVENARAMEPQAPEDQAKKLARAQLDPISRQENEAFDAMESKAAASFDALQARLGRQIEAEYANPNDAAA